MAVTAGIIQGVASLATTGVAIDQGNKAADARKENRKRLEEQQRRQDEELAAEKKRIEDEKKKQQAELKAESKRAQASSQKKKRETETQGRQSTIATGPLGLQDEASTGRRILLGI